MLQSNICHTSILYKFTILRTGCVNVRTSNPLQGPLYSEDQYAFSTLEARVHFLHTYPRGASRKSHSLGILARQLAGTGPLQWQPCECTLSWRALLRKTRRRIRTNSRHTTDQKAGKRYSAKGEMLFYLDYESRWMEGISPRRMRRQLRSC